MRTFYQFHEESVHERGLSFDVYIAWKVALKRCQFNMILNDLESEEEHKVLEKKCQAEAYRNASERK